MKISKILFLRKQGRSSKFLALALNVPSHKAKWKPHRDFVGADGTIMEAVHD